MLFLIFPLKLISQQPTVEDCLGAIPICDANYTEPTPYLYSGSGNYPNEINQTDMCIANENNGVWYIFTAGSNGYFRFTITAHDTGTDFDWSMFDITNSGCAEIYNNTSSLMVSANTWGSYGFNGPTGANSDFSGGSAGNCNGPGTDFGPPFNDDIPVSAGNTYVLYVSNWSASTDGYDIDFSESTGNVYDESQPIMHDVNAIQYCDSSVIYCHFNENILCSSVSTDDFQITGTGEPFEILEITSPTCEIGAEYGKDFIISFSPPLEMGDYQLHVNPQIPDESVIDLCGNSAEIKTCNFSTILSYNLNVNKTDITCNDYNDGIINASMPANETITYTINGGSPNTDGVFENLSEGTYTIAATTTSNCYKTAQKTIVNPPQAFSYAGEDFIACGVSIYQLEASESPIGTGTWTCSTAGVTFDNENIHNAIATIGYGTHVFTWTVENGVCGTFVNEVEITSYPAEALAGDVYATCEEVTCQLEANNPAPGTGVWTCETPEITFDDANSYNTIARNISLGTHTLTWQVDYDFCGLFDDQALLTYYNIPTNASIITDDHVVCITNITLDANEALIGVGVWTTEGGAIIENPDNNSTTVSDLDLGENIFKWEITNGICLPTNDNVSIINGKVSDAFAGDNQDVCQTHTFLAGNTSVSGVGTWHTNSGALINEINNPESNVEELDIGENIFIWTIANDLCPSSVDSVIVRTEDSPPIPDIETLPDVIQECAVTVSPPTARDNCIENVFATTENPVSYSEQGLYTITWKYIDYLGNTTFQTQNVIVKDITNPEIDCIEDVTVLIDTTGGNKTYITNGIEFDPVQMSDNCLFTDYYNDYNNITTLNLEEFYLGSHEVIWTVVDINDNKTTCDCEIFVDIDPRDFRDCDEDGIPNHADEDHCVIVPEGISPEGNGLNDYLIIEELERFPNNKITIFNRWGVKVYEASPYLDEWNGFDMFGVSIGDGKLPVGTYYYILYLDETYKPLQGYIYLVY